MGQLAYNRCCFHFANCDQLWCTKTSKSSRNANTDVFGSFGFQCSLGFSHFVDVIWGGIAWKTIKSTFILLGLDHIALPAT